jgi:hypothetical protein
MSLSRTIPAMDDRSARRDLALVAVTVVGLSRLADPPLIWLVAVLLLGAMLLGTLQVFHDETDPRAASAGVPVESLILPSVAAVACLGAIRLVPFGLLLVPALAVTFLIVSRTLALEAELHHRAGTVDDDEDRTEVLITILLVAFLGFTGVAAMVSGALPVPSSTAPLDETALLALVVGDAVVAALLGYRSAALRLTTVRDVLLSAFTYGVAIAIGAAAIRAMAIPRLVGPALLTLAFYLWDAIAATTPAGRRRWSWLAQTGLLLGLGIIVAAWNLLLRPPS